MKSVGWRCWYDDGSVHEGETLDDWRELAEEKPDHCLVKMIYYSDGGRQIQQNDWWIEIPHPKGVIRRTCKDEQKGEIEEAHPDAVFVKGVWTVDEWYNEVVAMAMESTWSS